MKNRFITHQSEAIEMQLATIAVSSHISVRGIYLKTDKDGKVHVQSGSKVYSGTLIPLVTS